MPRPKKSLLTDREKFQLKKIVRSGRRLQLESSLRERLDSAAGVDDQRYNRLLEKFRYVRSL